MIETIRWTVANVDGVILSGPSGPGVSHTECILMSIESYLLEISDRGWHVYTASQTECPRPDHWTVTLRQLTEQPTSAISYGQGRTLTDALAMAIDGMDFAAIEDKPAYTIHRDDIKSAPIDLSKLLKGIGPSISRRP